MGVVYEAEDINLGRHVALKFLSEHLYTDAKALDRFEREARAAALLSHPNICAIYEIEEDEGKPFLVMELLEGQDLKQRMQGQLLKSDEMLEIAIQTSDALMAAHSQGIVHRDIKPANIFITRSGQVRLLDFGLAKLGNNDLQETASLPGAISEAETLSLTQGVIGTAVYMSPEQVRGEELDARSDLFSFGVVLYEMATGRKPFQAKSSVMALQEILYEKPDSPLSINPNLHEDFEPVLAKALEKKREKRYQSARELRDDLRVIKRESELKQPSPAHPVAAHTAGKTFKGSGWEKYFKHILMGAGALLLLAIIAIVALVQKRHAAPAASSMSVAVLPFQDLGATSEDSNLRFTLMDQVTSDLSHAKFLDVKPVPPSGFPPTADAQKTGRALGVSTLVSGHFVREGKTLRVTMQAVDIATNRVLWQGSVSAEGVEALQEKLEGQVREGLLPQLAVPRPASPAPQR